MTKQTVYISYLILTPNFKNPFFGEGHETLIKTLRSNFFNWSLFFQKYGSNYSLGFSVNRKKGTETLLTKGPKISRKDEIVDYSIFLPDEIMDLNNYMDLVFDGVGMVLEKYSVNNADIESMKSKCKIELGL